MRKFLTLNKKDKKVKMEYKLYLQFHQEDGTQGVNDPEKIVLKETITGEELLFSLEESIKKFEDCKKYCKKQST